MAEGQNGRKARQGRKKGWHSGGVVAIHLATLVLSFLPCCLLPSCPALSLPAVLPFAPAVEVWLAASHAGRRRGPARSRAPCRRSRASAAARRGSCRRDRRTRSERAAAPRSSRPGYRLTCSSPP